MKIYIKLLQFTNGMCCELLGDASYDVMFSFIVHRNSGSHNADAKKVKSINNDVHSTSYYYVFVNIISSASGVNELWLRIPDDVTISFSF